MGSTARLTSITWSSPADWVRIHGRVRIAPGRIVHLARQRRQVDIGGEDAFDRVDQFGAERIGQSRHRRLSSVAEAWVCAAP